MEMAWVHSVRQHIRVWRNVLLTTNHRHAVGKNVYILYLIVYEDDHIIGGV